MFFWLSDLDWSSDFLNYLSFSHSLACERIFRSKSCHGFPSFPQMKRSLRYYIQSLHFKFLSLVSSSFSSSSSLFTRDTLTASTSRRFSSRRPSNGSPLFSFCTLKKENFLFNSPTTAIWFCQAALEHHHQ